MPLVKYFVFVGSTLLFILFGLDWYFPQPASLPIHAEVDKSIIRIGSVEQLPEKIIIDTNQPTTAPPPALEFVERWPMQTHFRSQQFRNEYDEPWTGFFQVNYGH